MTPDALDWDVLQERSLAWAKERWHWVVLIALSVWMYLVRMRPFGNFYRDDGIFFIGTDPYYHARHVVYTVANFPSTLGYDALTQYPLGTDPGQFGTLFDQGAALLAWIAGILVDGGAPSQETTMAVFVAYPAILGALTVFAVYALARRLVSRGPALFAALIIALLPGEFLVRSLAGYVDHHVMEALLSTLAMATLLWALQRWEASGVTLQGIVDAPKGLLDPERRGAWLATALAALAFTAYLWTWPSGVLFIGIVGLWLVVQAGWDVARAREIAPLLITVAGTFLPLALLMVLRVDRAGFTALTYSWMQPVAALGVALAAVAIAALAWVWHVRELPPPWYPGALAGGALLGLGAIKVLLPRLLSQVLSGLSWVTGIGVQRTRLTIAEAQPATFAEMSGEFGLLFWTAMFGFGLVVINALRKHKASDTLLILWAVLMTSATLTQVRFIYYLAVVVAVLNGELAHHMLRLARSFAQEPSGKGSRARDNNDPRAAQAVVAVLLALAVIPVHVTGFTDECRGEMNAWSLAQCFQPGEENLWRNQLVWMADHTPPVPTKLTTSFEPPPPGERYDYPEGTYGVLSWWDYGHQIQFDAQRPPIANPFQQQAPLASRIFTNATEAGANAILDDYLGEGYEARYLAIDDAMVSNKFGAITVWAGKDDVYQQGGQRQYTLPDSGQRVTLPVLGETVEDWFLIELYYSDGSGHETWRLVHESNAFSYIGNQARLQQDGLRILRYNDILGRVGADDARAAFGSLNFRSGDEFVPAGNNRFAYDVRVAASLKIFERVQGALIEGQADPGSEVTATLDLEVLHNARTFTYETETTAGPDGTFTLRLPYNTGANVAPAQGGTDSSVRALGPYTLTSSGVERTLDVPDRVVLDGGTLQVDLTRA